MRRALFVVALIGGVMALADGVGADFSRRTGPGRLKPAATQTVEAAQLAQWIRDGKRGLRILDGRSPAAYDWYHIPSAERASSAGTIVVIADGRELELRGGMQAWLDMLQRPGPLGRYFGGPPRRGGC